MRTRTIKIAIFIFAILAFLVGLYDTQVTQFLTLNVRYGIALLFVVILYSYGTYLQIQNNRLQEERKSHWEYMRVKERENERLEEIIIRLKTKPIAKKPARKK